MAFEIGTANDYEDFINKVREFLLTNVDLVNDGQAWEQVTGTVDDQTPMTVDDTVILRGPGLADDYDIYIRIATSYNVTEERYNMALYAIPAYNSGLAVDNQFNEAGPVYVYLWNDTMPYWIVANGRRVTCGIQVTTVGQGFYAGLFLPYATPSEYPLPLCIGGMGTNENYRYSTQTIQHSFFGDPGEDQLKVYEPNNLWKDYRNFRDRNGNYSYYDTRTVHPHQGPGSSAGTWRDTLGNLIECFGGEYALFPFRMCHKNFAAYGELEGCSQVSGIRNSFGNIIELDGVDHVVIQNSYKTDTQRGYWALRLE